MALFEGKTPAERNKMIAAIAMPLLALIFLYNMFSGPSKPSAASSSPTPAVKRSPGAAGRQAAAAQANAGDELASRMTPISCCPQPYGGEPGRNIFAFYVKPAAPVSVNVPTPPPATPAPTPPYVLAALTPQSVFARTAAFTLQLTGDKFGPAARAYLDGQELPTQYKSMQQLSANVPATLISSPGQRSVVVRTPDGQLYSNQATLNVMQPPAPTYTYVGFLKRQRANTAVLKDAKGELYSVRQGDLVEGRFRVNDITERGVEVVDKDLNIKHTMPFVDARGLPGSAPGRAPGSIQPPPPPDPDGDDEP
jgi:hypothetical protein